MLIRQIRFKNFKSYGNNIQELNFNTEIGQLVLLVGKNGAGKCVDPDTSIEIVVSDDVFFLLNKEPHTITPNGDVILKITLGELYEINKTCSISSLNIKVRTRYGFKKILNIAITAKNSERIQIITFDGSVLIGSPHHQVKNQNDWTYLKDLTENDIVATKSGMQPVIEVCTLDECSDLMDIEVEDVHEYYSNNIVSHNSTLSDVIDYVCYGAVRQKPNGKRMTLDKLPNRMNKELWSEIHFNAPDYEDIHIERTMNPNKVKLKLDNIPFDRATKLQDEIEKHISFDFESFKSFISMSINDFKNFMRLALEDKRKLMDRLFNLETIAEIAKIIKAMRSQLSKEMDAAETEINTLQRNIDSTKISIAKTLENQSKDIEDKIKKLKEDILSKKASFDTLNETIQTLDNRIKEYTKKKTDLEDVINLLKVEMIEQSNQIKAYRAGLCPTCKTELSDDTHAAYLATLVQKYNSSKELGSEHQNTYNDYDSKLETWRKQNREAVSQFESLKAHLTSLKAQIAEQKKSDETGSVAEFQKMLETFQSDIDANRLKGGTHKRKDIIYDKALEVFSDNGVKKMLISKVIGPMNKFIRENTQALELPFYIELDENFDATVYDLGQEIDSETLSTGETKKGNLAIMMAYIMLIRMKKHINILFLDEVFSSIDSDSIPLILLLLKKFAHDYNVNVFVVHHSEIPYSYFDRIIHAQKNVFSYLDDTAVTV